MSLHTGTAYEYTANGSNLNGGIFSATITNAGTDYSQQDAFQIDGSDLACTTGSSDVTSANPSASFTSALIGNGITIASGTNFTLSTYQITAVPDGNTLTLDRTPVGGSNGSSGAYRIGGAFAVPIDAHFELAQGGNMIYLKGTVTYTLAASISVSANNATFATPIKIIGYLTNRGDTPKGANMPTIDGGTSYVFTLQSYWHIDNVDLTGQGSSVLTLGSSGGIARNCSSTNSSASPDRSAISTKGGLVIECEAVSTLGRSVLNDTNALALLVQVYMHDSDYGAFGTSYGRFNADRCIFDTCDTGLVQSTAPVRTSITSCVFYNGSVAIDLGGAVNGVIENNIIHSFTTGITDASTNLSNVIARNVFYNNTNDATNVGTLDSSNLTGDPYFTDAPNKDFTIGSASSALDAGFDFRDIGLTGYYKHNIGVDQDDVTTAGGSATWAHLSFG